jgi:hypothetical protein
MSRTRQGVNIKELADMIGKEYGNWLVLQFVDYKEVSGSMNYMFRCECTCGAVQEISRTYLISKTKVHKSCKQCLRAARQAERYKKGEEILDLLRHVVAPPRPR